MSLAHRRADCRRIATVCAASHSSFIVRRIPSPAGLVLNYLTLSSRGTGASRSTAFTRCRFALLGLTLALTTLASNAHERDDEPSVMDPAAAAAVTDELAVIQAAATTKTQGCGKKAPRTGEFNLTTTDGNKKTRTYLVQIPSGYSDTRAYPLIFVFHGAGGNASQAYSWGLQNVSGASEDAIFIYPDGIQYKNYGVGWDDSKTGYDLPFFDNMVKNTEGAYCVNPQHVFAAGFSWGGDFVTALACTRGAVLQAIEVNSATDEYRTKSDSHTYQNSPCPSSVHPNVRFQHAFSGDSEYPAPLFATTSSLFQRFNTCSTSKTPVKSSLSGMSCYSYNSCSKTLVECSFPSSIGHNLPTNWAKDTWAFFASFW